MAENRVIQAFSESLQEHDLKKLRESASTDFEKQAISGEEMFQSLKLVNMPEGKLTVVKVVDKKDGDEEEIVEKRVMVKYGDKKKGPRIAYVLKRDGENGAWVVDNAFLNREDLNSKKSLAMRLAVLNCLRDSRQAWESAERDRILAVATPEMAQALSDLSPVQLAQFAKKVTADVAKESGVRPHERIGEETAELSIPKLNGEVVFLMRRVDDHWKLDDLKVKSRKGADDIESVRHMAAAMSSALVFQAAYRAGDKAKLQLVSTRTFYTGSLANAELTSVALPGAADSMGDFEVKLEGSRATFIVPAGDEVLKLSLVRDPLEKVHAAPSYRVDDVTIFELKTSQDKRLSALFTAQASLTGFAAALAAKDLEGLREFATHDFNERVWQNFTDDDLAQLPLAEFEPVGPRVIQTLFKGSLTEIQVEQGNTPLTYVLRDDNGRLLVDDVLAPDLGLDDVSAQSLSKIQPESLKAKLQFLRPVVQFADGLQKSQLDRVRNTVSLDFARLVWNHYDEKAPQFEDDPMPYLRAPFRSVRVLSGDRAEVVLGNRRLGARALLVRERGEFRIDNVFLVSDRMAGGEVALRQTIRAQLARNW